MFGSLFDDERPVGVMTNVHTLAVPRPPNCRLMCGLGGIENQGATCYLNSLLQTLLYTPEFREGLFGLSEDELGFLENRDKGGKVRIIPLQLQRLFARLLLVDQQAASTTELTDSFGWSNNEELQQHDVQELNRILFSAIDSSLVGTTGKDLITKLYHGSTTSEIVCQICGKISEREEDFLDLNVIVANYNNLQDSLNATFLQQEIMKGKNQYRCSTCCNLVDAKKGSKIRCLPLILTFSLLRFSYDIVKGERYKETGKFVFPFEIDMAPYCNKEMKLGDSTYELFSVVIHSGCSYGGHYHAFIRDVDGLGKWFPPEDESFTVMSDISKDVVNAIQDPVSLLKAILIEKEDHSLPMEVLCGEITKWTGVSWNKRFKSMYGVIVKFLQKNNEVFHYNAFTNMVYLKDESNSEPMREYSSSSLSDVDNPSGSPKETKKYAMMNSLKLNFFDKKRSQNNHSAYSHNWFDFNDARVSPILVKDIEKQYSGKESAYMLFYRRKSLVRPPEAKGNAKYAIPEKLLKLVEEENFELKRQRNDYETALNTVNIRVHLGNHYKCSSGVLEPKPHEISCLDLAIDKRKLLLDLRDAISKLCADLYIDQTFVLHTAREVPAGLHLYEELSESQNLETLKDLGILEGTKIFVWDGSQVGGEHFAIGVAHEPVLLNITVMLPNGEISEMSRGFPKTTTVSELKILINTLAPLPLDDIKISRVDLQGEENKLSPLTEIHNGRTLAELSFLDGDNIVAESIKYEQMQVKEENTVIKIVVQNCCDCMTSLEESNIELTELTVDLDSSVENLKKLAVSNMQLDDQHSYVLRKLMKNQGKRLPLHEHQTIREVGLSDTSYICIEEGTPPTSEQITVMFHIGVGLGDGPYFEITINKNISVHECLNRMLSLSGLTGDTWHLRKTNWCGEPMEQLSLDGATLEEEFVQHGENLLIMEGRLPPKGFLNFSIWLFPTLEKIPMPPAVNMNGLHADIESLLHNFGESVSKKDWDQGVKVGDVELSSESTVADLKKYVLTLPSLSNLSLPNIRYLRLCLLDNGRPSRVLRGLSNSLRKLKIQSHHSLAAQILFREEDLMQTELLLHLCQRIVDTKSYTPPLELTWDASKSASPKSLKQVIADALACSVQRIVVAKRFPEKCQWLIIDDGTNPKKGTKKKRWGTGKSNLRHSPYFLKDGDTLGVKDRLSDPDDVDDFLTLDDIEGQEILRIAAENKRIKRQEDKVPTRCSEWMLGGSDRELPRHTKKSEIGITIHVDDFT